MHRYSGLMAAVLVAVAFLSGVGAAQRGDVKEKLPDEAAAAQEQFVEAAARADKERDKKVADARAVMVKKLSSMVAAETRNGNLDGAVAIRQLIDGEGTAGKRTAGAIKGTWLVTLSNNGTFRYDLADDRVVLDVDKTPHPASRVVRKGDTLLAWIPVGGATHVHRYEVHGSYLVCQIWMDARRFDRGSPPLLVGLARRAE